MLIQPLDGTIRVPRALGGNLGRNGQGATDLAQPHEKLKALEAHVRALYVTRATFLAELRPIRSALCGAVGTPRAGVGGAVSGLVLR